MASIENTPLAAKPDRSWILWTVAIVVPCALVLLFVLLVLTFGLSVQAFGLRPYIESGLDMSPTLRQGDRLLAELKAYATHVPERGDVVLFTRDGSENHIWLKRVIAVGGDIIQGADDKVILNGKVLGEPYVAPIDTSKRIPDAFGPVTVPAGSLFVMGDNRQHSNDSRYFGCIDMKDLRGRAIYIYWSKDSARSWTRVR